VARRYAFLAEPPEVEDTKAMFDSDRESDGYVANFTRLWGWRPEVFKEFYALRASLMESSPLTDRDFAVLVTSTASELNDSYCSLAWGNRLAGLADAETAGQVLGGQPAPALSERESALSAWARAVVRDPNGTRQEEVDRLREAGLGDQEIFDATAFIAFRLAFSTVNDALGAAPDRQLVDEVPEEVRAAVTYGRQALPEPSTG
jgi:uncharacterized peroxidase-related enzyme